VRGVASRRVHAGTDEKNKVHEPEEDGKGGGGPCNGSATLVGGVVLAVVGVGVAAVAVARSTVVIVLLVGKDEKGDLGAGNEASREPDDERQADVSAGGDALLPLARPAGDEFGEGPDDAGNGLRKLAAWKD
jgi:hypothetical protein